MKDDIRTLLRVALVIKSPDGAQRRITAQVDRLPDTHPDDPGRGLETFRLSIWEDGKLEQQAFVLPSLSFLKDYLTRRLHRVLNTVDHNTDVVEIIEDTHRLIQRQSCYCQFCGRKFLEHYGYLGAVVKICRRCGKYTVCADASRVPKWH